MQGRVADWQCCCCSGKKLIELILHWCVWVESPALAVTATAPAEQHVENVSGADWRSAQVLNRTADSECNFGSFEDDQREQEKERAREREDAPRMQWDTKNSTAKRLQQTTEHSLTREKRREFRCRIFCRIFSVCLKRWKSVHGWATAEGDEWKIKRLSKLQSTIALYY